ncbi:D-2-hydroxyacid dehydrogenase [Streptomyces acidiscabies]|uniref:2-hydroxyacid dehydrogenase n=1 Tax=Streptomyces acidiscabies TaxID=42234 RepID=A0A0L0KNC1_9ACTN|nr:D-2-hydroxyacid dehydrogenase [Streptomyces acidiscabies]KND39070.1 2-hydroxyacid dehydrogenase [Streptomyces acidiscabies]MBZ3910551.1 D-2-hydroxyacid dehydrogenase [Streptomyces acidiscabies]MDX2959551.1 D-2-hydroxyacid dehydrogenase [Streptomyces acidiscabies]MDX3019161.1 D-2-hydroxyacid dehydrogenase [Streptomyces acidiscabies]MDX3790758.1 D-2-hydroxyacid dehydrogenase [Streptomyces acidiscabies]
MPAPTLLVLDADPLPRLGRLTGRATIVHTGADSLAARLPEADVLLVWDTATEVLRDAWAGEGARPAWVHVAGVPVDRVLGPALTSSDTVVTNARGVFEDAVAEYVMALVLAMAKGLPGAWEAQRARQWRPREVLRVGGTRAVVVGAGPVGRTVARALKAAGVGVALVGRAPRTGIHGPGDLDRLLARAEWVVAAAPLTEATRGMFDARRFGVMLPSARFVNVARGELVDEAALAEALRRRWIAGAALDVFAREPLGRDSPLWDVPDLLVTPRASGAFVGQHDRLAAQFVELWERREAGRRLVNVVDKARGYVPGH